MSKRYGKRGPSQLSRAGMARVCRIVRNPDNAWETIMETINESTEYDTTMLRYAQETRDAAVKSASRTTFIAWVVGIFAALSLIGMLVGVGEFISFANVVTSPATSTSADCFTQGGTDLSC